MSTKILVVSQSYPSSINPYSQAFIHSRNIEYKKEGIDVTVCSFTAKSTYSYEGICVSNEFSLPLPVNDFDIIVFHAPNLRNHLRFLICHWKEIRKIVIVFHGYEIMRIRDHVDPYFSFLKPSLWKRFLRYSYDSIKVPVIAKLIRIIHQKKISHFIFVSKHFRDSVIHDLKCAESAISESSSIIHNPVNSIFYQNSYSLSPKFNADFVTIRPFDEPKYGVDIVIEIAKKNPSKSFHIYGAGFLFDHIQIPANVTVFKQFLEQKKIPELLNGYRFALMPSRWDSQGVMSCEMAVFGIPVITSDLPVFKEVLSGFSNVSFINNESPDLPKAIEGLLPHAYPLSRFNVDKTVSLELKVFNEIVGRPKSKNQFKILLLTDAYPFGTSEAFVHDELKELSKYSDVEILPLVKRSQQFYKDLPENVIVHSPIWKSLSLKEFVRKALFRGPPLSHFFPVEPKYLSPFSNLTNYLKAIYITKSLLGQRRLQEILKKDFDVVYFYWGVNFAYILPHIKLDKKSVVKFHAYDVYETPEHAIPFKREILGNMDLGIFIAQDGYDHTLSRYPEFKSKYHVCRLGVHFHGLGKRSQDGVLRIVSCSYIVPVKRVRLIVEALRLCRKRVHWTHFGDGPLKEEIVNLLSGVKNPNLTWELKGHVPNIDIRNFYVENPVDLFVHASEAEGIPVAIMEALSAGIPVIATDAGGTREIINENVGFLLPINFQTVFLADLIEAHSDPEILNKKSKNAYEFWANNLDAPKNHKKFFELLLELKNSHN